MKNWQLFEKNCFDYLYDNFNEFANFEIAGGFDSTVSDIKVTTKTKEFYIEVKKVPSQCGQFVLIPDNNNRQFIFSHLNFSKLTSNTQIIINYMNNHFDEFLNVGTKGCDIVFNSCDNIFANWIINYYKDKGVKFIITNNYLILPINKFNTYFNISCAYRVKKSGSSGIALPYKESVINYLLSLNLKDFKYDYNNGHLNIYTLDNVNSNTFKINDNTFMFSKRDNCYEIRKLSNTYNANVIFSIDLKTNCLGLTNNEFSDYLTQ